MCEGTRWKAEHLLDNVIKADQARERHIAWDE